MNKKNKERVIILIDGSNFYYSTAKKGKRVNFLKLIDKLVGDKTLVNAYYYIAPLDIKANEEKYWSHQRFLDKLKQIPKFKVILCSLNIVRKRYKKKIGNAYFSKSSSSNLRNACDFKINLNKIIDKITEEKTG